MKINWRNLIILFCLILVFDYIGFRLGEVVFFMQNNSTIGFPLLQILHLGFAYLVAFILCLAFISPLMKTLQGTMLIFPIPLFLIVPFAALLGYGFFWTLMLLIGFFS